MFVKAALDHLQRSQALVGFSVSPAEGPAPVFSLSSKLNSNYSNIWLHVTFLVFNLSEFGHSRLRVSSYPQS